MSGSVDVLKKTNGHWVYMAPVVNLELTDAVRNEFVFGQVTFIRYSKLKRVIKRFGLTKADIQFKQIVAKGDYNPHRTIAVVSTPGTPESIAPQCYEMVRDELFRLSASQLYYRQRNGMCLPVIANGADSWITHHFRERNSGAGLTVNKARSSVNPLTLDRDWKQANRSHFFGYFIKARAGALGFEKDFRDDIVRAVTLVGRSIHTRDRAGAFLWNMVALEVLLTRKSDRGYSKLLPQRIEALIGWINDWSSRKFPERIKEVYKQRCAVVHAGRVDDVTPDDLIFSEDLVMNTLFNVLRHPKLFKNKDDLINFAELVRAEKLLGLKRWKVRPKTLTFFHRKRNANAVVESESEI